LLTFAGANVVGGITGARGGVVVALSIEGMDVFVVMVPSAVPFPTGTVVEFPPGEVVMISPGGKEGSAPLTMVGVVVTIVEVFVSFPLGTGAALGCMVLLAGDVVAGGNVVVTLGSIVAGFCEFDGSIVVFGGTDKSPVVTVGDPVMFLSEVGILVSVKVALTDGACVGASVSKQSSS
jgi:hypothetical protein